MPPGHGNTTSTKIRNSAAVTRDLLSKAHADPALRDKLLKSPAETLKGMGITDPGLVNFLTKLDSQDFEDGMKHRAGSLDAEAEAEA